MGSQIFDYTNSLFPLILTELNASSKRSSHLLGMADSKELLPASYSPGIIWHCSSPHYVDVKSKGPPLRRKWSLEPRRTRSRSMLSNTQYRAQGYQRQKASSGGLTQLTRSHCFMKLFNFVLEELSHFWSVMESLCCISPLGTQEVRLTRRLVSLAILSEFRCTPGHTKCTR